MKWQQRGSCRNWSKLLADYVAFTGSGAAGGGLDE